MKKILMCVSIFILIYSCDPDKKEIKIEPGQIWKYFCGTGSPYDKPEIHYNKVIDINGDYVFYVQDRKDTLNAEKTWFTLNSELIKN